MPGIDLKKELESIAKKLELVEQAGHGEVIIRVADGKVVYIEYKIGEKVKTK